MNNYQDIKKDLKNLDIVRGTFKIPRNNIYLLNNFMLNL